MNWLLDLVPMWFRTRWPMKRWYWQAEEVDEINRIAQEIIKEINWSDQ